VRRPKETRIVSVPARPSRPKCHLCGRERLSREEYAWRRKNGYAVWRCQHRRPSPSRSGELWEALVLIAMLAVGALAAALYR
jgi:hypothetical protein